MKSIYIIICLFFTLFANAQEPSDAFLIYNISVHVGNGKVYNDGMIAVEKGKIRYAGAANKPIQDQFKLKIDGKGQHAYPSFIAPNTRLGLEEVEAVRSTRDFSEVGVFNPSIRSIIAYNTDSQIIPTVRSNGILLAQIVPQGGTISGRSSLVYTEADNWEDALVSSDNLMHLRWPSRVYVAGWWAQRGGTYVNKKYDERIQAIKVYIEAARAYCQNTTPQTTNVKFEAMRKVLKGQTKLVIHAKDVKEIMDAVSMLRPYNIKCVIQGGHESWQITEFLKKNDVEVILHNVHRLPGADDADIDQPYKTAAMLNKAGIPYCLSMEGSWNVRNLPFQAGQCVGYGLSKEEALASITLSAAKILGVDDRIGSLEVGKEATFIISKGDVLDVMTSQITAAYISGKVVDLGNKQKELYDKYMKKFNLSN